MGAKYSERVSELFEHFIDQFLIGKDSILTQHKNIVSEESIHECYDRYIKGGIEGDRSYKEKINEQFGDADLETRLVFAHAEWLWSYAVSDINEDTKKGYTRYLLDLENGYDYELQDVYAKGFGSGGERHTRNKYGEIKFSFLVIKYLHEKIEKDELKTVEEVKEHMEQICLYKKYGTEDDALNLKDPFFSDMTSEQLAMPNILLHLAYPEKYERIASNKDKRLIYNSFSPLLYEEINKNKNLNIDEKLKILRDVLTEQVGGYVNFYSRNLKKVWNYSLIEDDFDEIQGLEYKKALILYGPPGTSKTYSAKQLAETLITKYYLKDKKNVPSFFDQLDQNYTEKDYLKDRIHHLQLHPSYSYEDFVAGMQLRDDETKAVEGKLFDICEKASKDKKDEERNDIPHVLILDEINRVDLSQLFGEVFSALENREEPIEVSVQNKKKFELTIPRNLYVIGTMNEIDFSLERIDFALRRRFLWIEYPFREDRLKTIIQEKFEKFNGSLKEDELDRFTRNAKELNKKLTSYDELGDQYQVGHTFFSEIAEIYESYLKLHDKSYLQNKIYKNRGDGPAKKLWDYSIEPIIDSFFGSINAELKKERIEELREIYFEE